MIDDESLYALVTPDPKYEGIREQIGRQFETRNAWLIPFISLVWVEDLLLAAWKRGDLSREAVDAVRESIDDLSGLFLFPDKDAARRYVSQVRKAIRAQGEVPTYDAWIMALIEAVRAERPGADVRFLTLNARLADAMPLDDVLLLDIEAL